ncbi:MAG TPA: DUF4388 domain-containing protein [Kofleriaceae bacterium]
MSKQSLLLVDGDTRSLRVLEVSLRKAGFTVTPASSVTDALDKLELHTPDLIISETKFSNDMDGFELRRRLRASSDWAEIPFVFLTTETAIENKIRGLELGVEDYLTKPIYIKEIVTRINILLQKKQRAGFEARKDGVRFAGRVADMPVVDVIQTIEISRKSGLIHFVGIHGRTAAIYFRDGKVIDAEAGTLQGEDAVYRLLTWSEGEFEVEFRTVRRREAIATSSQGLLMEGMRRLDEWTRLLEQLPTLTHRFEVDSAELAIRLGDVPDEHNRILRLFDGKRSLLEVIDASAFGDLECLQAISRLYFEGMLLDLDPDQPAKRITGKPMPLVQIDEAPTPMEEVASGPIPDPPSDATQPVDAEDVIEEEEVEPGPLEGQYRPSSLRLIDEAVAAAQAIEPSLFDPEELAAAGLPIVAADGGASALAKVQLAMRGTDPRVITARDLVEKVAGEREDHSDDPRELRGSNGAARTAGVARATTLEAPDPASLAAEAAIPTAIEAEEPAPPPPRPKRQSDRPEDSGERRRFAATIRREDSGLRMIGSHGRDRAEASGELRMPLPDAPPSEPQRELVTIMPRRRESQSELDVVPAVEPPKPAPSEAKPVAPPAPPPPPRVAEPRAKPAAKGPGPRASALLVAVSVLAGVTTYMYCHKKPVSHPVAAPLDAGTQQVVRVAPPIDAEAPAIASDAAAIVHVDAGRVAQVPRDATPPAADAAVDRVKAAKELYDQAHAALEDGDFERALALTDASLKYRRTARTLLERARALQRLDRIDDALASVDQALGLVSDYAPAFEQRAMILWSARRYDEARDAMTKYIELDPDGSASESFKRMLAEPR